MNERIRELALQAGLITEQDDRENWQEYINDVEKFAELIVAECANRLAEDFIPEDDIIEGYNDTWDSALRFGVRTIKEHFGVEE